MELPALIRKLAQEPNLPNRNLFYRSLAVAEVAVPLFVEKPHSGEDGMGVPIIKGPNGKMMLVVYAEKDDALAVPSARACFTLAARNVLEMARTQQVGLLVQTGSGPTASWAGVPVEDVPALLK